MVEHKISFRLRPVEARDERLVWEWSNDPVMLQFSFQTKEKIPWENHQKWFAKTLAKQGRIQYIAETPMGEPIGQVRFEPIDSDVSVISVYLAEAWRGKKLAPVLIQRGVERIAEETNVRIIEAWIKTENAASRRAFLAAGFEMLEQTIYLGQSAWHLQKKYTIARR